VASIGAVLLVKFMWDSLLGENDMGRGHFCGIMGEGMKDDLSKEKGWRVYGQTLETLY